MKKQMCSLALCAIFGLGAAMAAPVAQDQTAGATGNENSQAVVRHHRADPNRRLHFLTKKLNLTDDQQKQILPLLTQQQDQMQQIFSDSSLARKDRFEKVRAVREQTESGIKAVLNDQQKQQYDELQQQRREKMQQRRQERQNGAASTGNPS